MEIKIADTELKEITSIFYRILIPRPIAWVSTKSKNGILVLRATGAGRLAAAALLPLVCFYLPRNRDIVGQ